MFDRRHFIRTTGAVLGGSLFVGSASAGGNEIDNYELVGQAPVPGVNEIVTRGDWAYATSAGSLATINVNDPEFPVVSARVRGERESDTPDVNAAGDVAALAHDDYTIGGVSLFDVTSPTNPTYEAFYNAPDGVHNLFLKESPDGENVYAYLGITDSFDHARMVIVDVTDPANPSTLEGPDGIDEGANMPDDQRGTNGAWMLRDAREDMANGNNSPLHDLYVLETDEGTELAYCCFWDSGVVVVDVTEKRHPVAVGHFGATQDAFGDTVDYVTGEKSNAHYAQPTPDRGYTFVGAETFPGPSLPPGEDVVQPAGDHGGIRVFDTRAVAPLAEGGRAIYPEADDSRDHPDAASATHERLHDEGPFQNPDPDRRNPDNPADMVAYLPAPEGVDDAALTSHHFDVTERMLFSSWYRGGIRAYDLTTLYHGGDYEEHARNPRKPLEVGTFAVDGTAYWTAENVEYEEDPTTIYTLGSDIGKGAVTLKLERGPGGPL
jgi:hypothetical protein